MSNSKKVTTTFDNGFEVQMTMDQAKRIGIPINCIDDCLGAIRKEIDNGLGNQFKGKKRGIKSTLEFYGVFEDWELKDRHVNMERILWMAAGNILMETDNIVDDRYISNLMV